MDQTEEIVIATRESRLALWQAEHVKALLEAQGARVRLLGMTTKGDRILDRTLSKVGGKGLFVKELETALLDGRAQLAVHSLKDLPMLFPPGLTLSCVMQREDPRDAWISPHYARLQDLPHGAIVGTASLRRTALLKVLRPDLTIKPLRGNLDTRLGKLDAGEYAGIVLASAGLKRLGYASRIRHIFSADEMLPAAGQGALGLEIASDRADLHRLLAPLRHFETAFSTAAERTVSRVLGGSCSMPLAAFAQWQDDGNLLLRAMYGDLETAKVYRAKAITKAPINQTGLDLNQAVDLGNMVAQDLIRQGVVPAL